MSPTASAVRAPLPPGRWAIVIWLFVWQHLSTGSDGRSPRTASAVLVGTHEWLSIGWVKTTRYGGKRISITSREAKVRHSSRAEPYQINSGACFLCFDGKPHLHIGRNGKLEPWKATHFKIDNGELYYKNACQIGVWEKINFDQWQVVEPDNFEIGDF